MRVALLIREIVHRLPHLLSQDLLVSQLLRQMGNSSVFSRFVLSLKVGYRTLQPLQQTTQSLGGR